MTHDLDACTAVRAQSSRFLDGRLPAIPRRSVQNHLRACPDCLAEFRSTLALARLARRVPRRAAPADLAQRTRTELAHRRREAARRLDAAPARTERDLVARRAAAALLAFALAAAAFVLGRATAPHAPTPAAEPTAPADTVPAVRPPADADAPPPTPPPGPRPPEPAQFVDPPLPVEPASETVRRRGR